MKISVKFYKDYPQVKGVSIKGCVNHIKMDDDKCAHAHTGDDPYSGWICFYYKWLIVDEEILTHELAHLLSGDGHTKKWKKQQEQFKKEYFTKFGSNRFKRIAWFEG